MEKIDKKIIILGIIILLAMGIYFAFSEKEEEVTIDLNEVYENQNEVEEPEIATIIVHVTGEVKNQGIIILEEGSRIADAIEKAGGLTENADVSKVNLAYTLEDGQKIYIPSVHDEEVSYIEENAGNGVIVEDINGLESEKVNINTATQTELETLPGIGSSTALKIITYREEHGKFKKKEDIMNVSGIGEAKYEVIKEKICVK